MDGVLTQLEEDPAARFVLDGQTVLVEDYLAIRPDAEERIRTQVQRGALEVGPWYVLSDLLIPSAESLRRNLREGARDAARLGRRLDVLYSPDAFGHPAGLPRLAAEFGIRRAVIRRGFGRPEGRDRDLYRWDSLLVYHLPASGYDVAIDLAAAGRQLARVWAPIRAELAGRAVTRQIAVFLGADHHAMAPGVSALAGRLQALEREHRVQVSGLTEFFEAVDAEQPDPPVIRGELRRGGEHTWVLQDVLSTRSRMKRQHTAAEQFLARVAEPLAGLSAAKGGVDRSGLLTDAWRRLLRAQFHDTLAGTTSDAVQADQERRLAAVMSGSAEVARASLLDLAGADPDAERERKRPTPARLLLWNPSEQARGGIVTAEVTLFREDVLVGPPGARRPRRGLGHKPFALLAPDGATLPVQVLGVQPGEERRDFRRHYPDHDRVDRIWVAFRAPRLDSFAATTLVLQRLSQTPDPAGLTVSGRTLANRFVSVTLSPTGTVELTDLATGAGYRGIGALEDEPDQGDLYTFSPGSGATRRDSTPGRVQVLARGPLVGALELIRTIRSAGEGWIGIRQVVWLDADAPLVRIRYELTHQARDHRLRIRIPVGAGRQVMAGAAFGAELRGVEGPAGGELIERPVRTAPAHRVIAAAEGNRGLAVLVQGVAEYEWTEGRDILVTLLRATGELSRDGLPERPGHAGYPTPTPGGQEPGRHVMDLALAPVTEDALQRPEALAWMDPAPPLVTRFVRGEPTG